MFLKNEMSVDKSFIINIQILKIKMVNFDFMVSFKKLLHSYCGQAMFQSCKCSHLTFYSLSFISTW